MTAIAAGPQCSSFRSVPRDRGVSPEAKRLAERLWKTIGELLESEALGDPVRRTLLALEEACGESWEGNWDGYGARPVSEAARYHAEQFINMLPTGIPVPEVSVEPDGEIAFEWHRGRSGVLSVSVGDRGRLTYGGLFGRSKTHGVEYLEDELPETIAAHLRRVLSR